MTLRSLRYTKLLSTFCFCFLFTFFLFTKKTYGVANNKEFCLKAPVLYYHHIEPVSISKTEKRQSLAVTPEVFEDQMKYLKENDYQTIFAEDLAKILIQKTSFVGKLVVVTIDDGYSDVHDHAFTITKNYDTKLNLMIPTGLLEKKGHLSWMQTKDMVDSGLVRVYNHTWSHAALTKLNEQKMVMEIITAKQQLQDHLGLIFPLLVYPYGVYNESVVEIARASGFIAGFSTKKGFLQCDSFIMNLHRIGIGNVSLARYGL